MECEGKLKNYFTDLLGIEGECQKDKEKLMLLKKMNNIFCYNLCLISNKFPRVCFKLKLFLVYFYCLLFCKLKCKLKCNYIFASFSFLPAALSMYPSCCLSNS